MTKILFYESRPEWGGAQKCELELLLGLESYGLKPCSYVPHMVQ